MKGIMRFGILFLFILFLATSVFAQEAEEALVAPEKEVATVGQPEEGVITGEITSLDVDSGVISVKTDNGIESTFSVIDGETILWEGIEDIELSGISKGEEAEVGYYTDESGNLIASWVDVLIEEEIIPEEIISLKEAASSVEETVTEQTVE